MKKHVSKSVAGLWLVAVLGGSLLTACKKDYVEVDEKLIKKHISDNRIADAQRQPSGLYFVPLTTNAQAVRPVTGDTVSVLYTGKLLNGTVFDASSRHGNVPISFRLGLGRVIAGWDEGIALMHEGDRALLLIPSAAAYGAAGAPPTIPANTVLQFEVELVHVQ